MGIWKNLRPGAAFMREYQQDAMKTVPRWTFLESMPEGCDRMAAPLVS
jgi:hypothetical protein